MTSKINCDSLLAAPPQPPRDLSESEVAKSFSQYVREIARFVPGRGWYVYNGVKWEQSSEKIGLLLQRYIDSLQTLYLQQGMFDKASQFNKFKNKNPQYNVLSLAKRYYDDSADSFDADPFVLNTPGGVVDLQTGNITAHKPDALCTKITRCSPSDEGRELWTAFLSRLSGGDPSFEEFLQYVVGMGAIGKVFVEALIIAYGPGNNGKSTFFNSIASVLGNYSWTINSDVLLQTRFGSKEPALAELPGRRFVLCNELEPGQKLSTVALKRLTSTDKISVEAKYKQPIEIVPSHTIILCCNHLPRVLSSDEGTWRRLKPVPFNAVMPVGSENIPNYASVLVERAGGAILQWIIDGAVKFTKNECRLPDYDVADSQNQEYRRGEDWLTDFIASRCVCGTDERVLASELYTSYRDYAKTLGDEPASKTEFSSTMMLAGFRQTHPQNRKTWVGLKIKK